MRQSTPIIVFSALLFLSSGVFAQQNYYSVKFPDDQTIISCGGTADTTWPAITYINHCNFNVGISVKDQVFNLNNTGGCKKILRTWKLLWWCDYDPNTDQPFFVNNPSGTNVGPTVIGNSQNHGYLQYTQIIKIVDNVAPFYTDCPTSPLLFCDYTNNDPTQYGTKCEGPFQLETKVLDDCSGTDLVVTYRLYLDLDCNGTMETFRSSSDAGAWPIGKTFLGDTVCAKVLVPAGVGLPYAKHKIEWVTSDRCGNDALCKYEFEVRDCKAPTVVCINGLSINIMQTGMITLWDTDFLLYTEDNCTPTSQIKLGIRKAGTGTGFPTGQNSVTFDCNELGQQFVEIWAVDAYGNADYCATFVNVQDNMGACSPVGPVTGTVTTAPNQPLMGAKILLKSNLPTVQNQSSTITDAQGQFVFPSAPGTCNYSLIPSLDTLARAGVSTLDIIHADLHLLGTQALTNPYQIIAADVNKDNVVNQADLDAMSDLVLGLSDHFIGNTAWRFVPANFVFPSPNQPLSVVFPEKISTTCPMPSGLHQHFIAIKTGDVDGSWGPNASSRLENENKMLFHTFRRRFEADDEIEVVINTPDLSEWAGFQFTLEANAEYLSLLEVTPGSIAPRMGVDEVANRVACSWYSLAGVAGPQTALILRFKTLKAGFLHKVLFMNASVTAAEAYDKTLQKSSAVLGFGTMTNRSEITTLPQDALQTLQVSPNPTNGPVTAAFYLPQAGPATLILRDVNGRVISEQTSYYDAGNQQVTLQQEVSGVLFLSLQSASGTTVRRVLSVR